MIDHLGDFVLHNLIVLVAIVLVPMKLIVLRLCGDSEAQATALLAVPEDICYVSLGLVLGDVATSGHAFRKYFRNSAHVSIDLVLTMTINVGVAVVIHLLSKASNDHFKSWRAADLSRADGSSKQIELPITSTDESIRMIQVRHLAIFSVSYFVQMVVVIAWMKWIATVVANQ